ncbi:MAG: glutathione S-transferase family protein [Lysobacterales bacterium]|jgi:glutathione S-transferase|nr:MAG: glutathione S-transferase family protein [Xanthomonadales bacterium]
MTTDRRIVLHHAPNTRSTGTLILLEELAADYELDVLDFKAGEHHSPEYLAINPMGKVPAIVHAGTVVTEQVAIYLYLADLYADRGLAPQMGDALRGAYLRWLVFYGTCFEPAIIDRSQQRAPAPASTSPYGDFDTLLGALTARLEHGPNLLGETFTAADVLWGTALGWTTQWGLVPKTPVIERYVQAFDSRPAAIRVRAADAELAARMV